MQPVTTNPDAWYALPVLTGTLIRLEPLTVEHAAGYLAAAGTGADADEVFRWLNPSGSLGAPRNLDEATTHILTALAARARGERLPYAQIDLRTGQFAGTTSYYEINPATRAIAIGHTWLGRPWWRTGHNTDSKLLMLMHAFDTLGAARVVWHTDIFNTRSQDAIARLGAVREGVLRKHRIRRDGSWRDTVQFSMTDDDWPGARDKLAASLRSSG
jgi:RimJ/RimL family protein N-acetyltransferase